jgi:hypothetical protein
MGVKWGCLDGRRWCYGGGRRGAAVVMGWCLGGGFLDVREFGRRENTEEVGELYGAGEKMGKRKKVT